MTTPINLRECVACGNSIKSGRIQDNKEYCESCYQRKFNQSKPENSKSSSYTFATSPTIPDTDFEYISDTDFTSNTFSRGNTSKECGYLGCNLPVSHNGKACLIHECSSSFCKEERAYGSDYCYEHTCSTIGCREEVWTDRLCLDCTTTQRYCAHCGDRFKDIFESDFDLTIDRVTGKKLKFCNERCIQKYRDENFCFLCDEKLNGGKYKDYIRQLYNRKITFCSSTCLKKFERKHICEYCNGKIKGSYYYDDNYYFMNDLRFCSKNCINNYRKKNTCVECNNQLGSNYYSDSTFYRLFMHGKRFCSNYCLNKFRDRQLGR